MHTAEDIIHKSKIKTNKNETIAIAEPIDKVFINKNRSLDSISSISDKPNKEIKKIRKRPVITKNINSENFQTIRKLDGSFNYK